MAGCLAADVAEQETVVTLQGDRRRITGAVTAQEALALYNIVVEDDCTTTLETGVAFGISTLAICEALQTNGGRENGRAHFGMDPLQYAEHGGAAIATLRRHGLGGLFHLLEAPTHMAAPQLLERGVRVQFAFIDGYHTFDYSLVDLFFADKLLEPGGRLAIHDMWFPAKKKLARFLMGHRRYRFVRRADLKASWRTRVLNVLRRVRRADPYCFWWLPGGANLAVFQKIEDYEPEWSFFKNF